MKHIDRPIMARARVASLLSSLVALTLVLLKGITWSQTMLQKRRHLRALEDVKKM